MCEGLQREERESQGQWQSEWTREMHCGAAGMHRCPLKLAPARLVSMDAHTRSSGVGLCPVMTSLLSLSCSSASPVPNNTLQALTKRLREGTIRQGDMPIRCILCPPGTKAKEIWKVSCSSGPWRAISISGFQNPLPLLSCRLCF